MQTPLERAVQRVRDARYALADILIVSDGGFGVTPATLESLRRCKKTLDLRVHGILIGDRETIGLLEVCDPLHWVRAWRRYATASGVWLPRAIARSARHTAQNVGTCGRHFSCKGPGQRGRSVDQGQRLVVVPPFRQHLGQVVEDLGRSRVRPRRCA